MSPRDHLAAWIGFAGAMTVLMAVVVGGAAGDARAQSAGADVVRVPGFWDPRRRPERPDMSRITVIRFLTETDYPPFNFAGADGNPQGFNVDLARAICEELKVGCTIQQAALRDVASVA